MRKALMIVSLTAFAAAAFAAPSKTEIPASTSTSDEVAILPVDDASIDPAQKADEKDCGCGKGKKGKK